MKVRTKANKMGRSSSSSSSTSSFSSSSSLTSIGGMFTLASMLFCLFLPSPLTIMWTARGGRSSLSPYMSTFLTAKKTSPSVPMCPHVLLLSAARHGSTWFVDSVERCRFSSANNGTSFGQLNKFSELWMTSHDGPLLHMKFNHALDYVTSFMSVKIFPWTWKLHADNVTSLTRAAYHGRGVPVVVLTRKHADAYRSFMRAQEKGEWNNIISGGGADDGDRDGDGDGVASKNVSVREVAVDLKGEHFKNFVIQRDQYFNDVKHMLQVSNIAYDQVDYDEIKVVKWIHLAHANCYIRNCNDWATG